MKLISYISSSIEFPCNSTETVTFVISLYLTNFRVRLFPIFTVLVVPSTTVVIQLKNIVSPIRILQFLGSDIEEI